MSLIRPASDSALRFGDDSELKLDAALRLPTDVGLRRAPSPAGVRRSKGSPSSFACRPTSPAEIRRPHGLAAAGKSMVNLRPAARPDSPGSDGEDDGGLADSLWRKKQRESIKKGSLRASRPEPRPNTSGGELGKGTPVLANIDLLKAPQELPPLQGVRHRPMADRLVLEAKGGVSDVKEGSEAAAKRVRSDAQAQASACWEDIISFLELHKLSGAYALAFSAFGIEDLSSLLLLDDAGLSSLLERCNIDAMDEILLLEAVRSTRPSQ